MYESLYLKYRPNVFSEIVGQDTIVRTLQNAIINKSIAHSYLFTGPRGTGKTTTARIMAKALLCKDEPTEEPDGDCEDCLLISQGKHPDVIELDAASNTGVDNVRVDIIDKVAYAPLRKKSKIFIIDEVHMLSTPAFNALLKTLEEPPSNVIFILCTTDPQKVPETIKSRCQFFQFHRISQEAMVSRLGAVCLAEEYQFEGEALDLIAQRADGGLRNALTSLEQIVAFNDKNVTLEGAEYVLGSIDSDEMSSIMRFIGVRDIVKCYQWLSSYVETGADLAHFVEDMAEHVKNLYILALAGDDAEIAVNDQTRHELAKELSWFSADRAARLLGVLGELGIELKTVSNPRLSFEIALTRMVRPDSDITVEALYERIDILEDEVAKLKAFHSTNADINERLMHQDQSLGTHNRDTIHNNDPEPRHNQKSNAFSQVAYNYDHDSNRQHEAEILNNDLVPDGEASHSPQTATEAPFRAKHGAVQFTESAEDVNHCDSELSQSSKKMPSEKQSPAHASKLDNSSYLQRMWGNVLSSMRAISQPQGILFNSSKMVYDASIEGVKIVIPPGNDFVYKQAQKQNVQDNLAKCLEKHFGRPLAFSVELGGQVESRSKYATTDSLHAANQKGDHRYYQTHASVQSDPLQPVIASVPLYGIDPAEDEGYFKDGIEDSPRVENLKEDFRHGVTQKIDPVKDVPDSPYDQVPYEEIEHSIDTYNDYKEHGTFDEPSTEESQETLKAYGNDLKEQLYNDSQPGFSEQHTTNLSKLANNVEDTESKQDNMKSDNEKEEKPDLQSILEASFGSGIEFESLDK